MSAAFIAIWKLMRLLTPRSMLVMLLIPPCGHRPSKKPLITGRRSSARPFQHERTMSYSYTLTETTTFTLTHAKHMAAKVATDLKRMQRLYNLPSDTDINNYEAEVIEL